MASDQKLDYKIKVAADVRGATEATAAIGKVEGSATQAGKTTAAAAAGVQEVGKRAAEAGDKGSQALKQQAEITGNLTAGANVLSEGLRGNVRALAQFPAVLRAIAVATAANPLFAIGAVAGAVIVPALTRIKDGWQAQAAAAKEAAARNSEALSAARAAIGERRRNETAEAFNRIATEAERARVAINRATQAQLEATDLEEAVGRASIDADERLNPVQRATALARNAAIARERRRRIELNSIDSTENLAVRTEEVARRRLPDAQAEEARAQNQEAAIRARSPQILRDEQRALEQERNAVVARATALELGGGSAVAEREQIAALNERIAAAEAAVTEALENYDKRLEAAEAETAKATAARVEAEAKLADAFEKRADAEAEALARRSSVQQRADAEGTVQTLGLGRDLREAGASPAVVQREVAQVTEAANKTASAVASQAPIDTSAASGGIIKIGETFIAIQGENRRAFGTLEAAIQSLSVSTQAELRSLRARIDNMQSAR